MPTLSESRITDLLQPFLAAPAPGLVTQLSTYLDLLLRWNARTNLTAIRDPEDIVRRHFGESLFAAAHLQPLLPPGATLFDLGSGAGFPGLPIQLLLPHLRVTLAESQGKKAAFLREAVRTLGLATEVWAQRAEDLPASPSGEARRFDCVTLRAVDNMPAALNEARRRSSFLAVLAGETPALTDARRIPIPGTEGSFLYLSI